MAYQFIMFDRNEGVGTVTLNRPDQLNALTPAMLQELSDVFRGMERDPQVRAILITGAGKAFCGGEDFRQRAESSGSFAFLPPTPPTENSPASFGFDRSEQGAINNPRTAPVSQPGPNWPHSSSQENPRTQPLPWPGAEPTSVASNNSGNTDPNFAEAVRMAYNPLIRHMRQIEKPIIAAINGIAAGTGLGLALACDIRYASERARFMEVSIRVGLLPGSGIGYLLPRLIGLSKSLELLLNGDEVSATEAAQLELVSKVLPADQLLEESRQFAARLAKGPTRAIGLTKNLVYRAASLNLDQALELEAQLTDQALQTQDYQEGLQAFIQKRPPQYRGQ